MPSTMRPTTALLSFALLAAPFAAARAQVIRLGDTVLVRHPKSLETEGVLVCQDAATLRVRALRGTDTTVIARADITSLNRRQGEHRRGWVPVGYGLGIGFAVGAALGFADGDDKPGWFSMTASEKAVLGGTALSLVGALGGAFVAAMHVPNWVPVQPAAMSIRVAPVDGRLGIAMQ